MLQRHSDAALLAAGEAEFAGQSSHAEAPAEYLPASHGTHVDCDVAALADEYVPASQLGTLSVALYFLICPRTATCACATVLREAGVARARRLSWLSAVCVGGT